MTEIMGVGRIPRKVILTFDPKEAGGEIKKIFRDDLARTLWLAVKSGHVVSQYFNSMCTEYARVIRKAKQKSPLTARQLLHILSGVGRHPGYGIIGENELPFAQNLLLFVNGERICYEVKK